MSTSKKPPVKTEIQDLKLIGRHLFKHDIPTRKRMLEYLFDFHMSMAHAELYPLSKPERKKK